MRTNDHSQSLRKAGRHTGMLCVAAMLLVAGCGSHIYHYVRQGDTLYSISFNYGYDYREVARWNGIRSPYIISPGQRLRVSPPASGSQDAAPQIVTSIPEPVASRPAQSTATVVSSQPIAQTTSPQQPIRWAWPADGGLLATFSANTLGKKGVDIAGNSAATVRAAADGRVVYSGSGLTGYGNLLIIKHDDTFLSAYAHNSELLVREGDQVRSGQTIARMGATGTDRVKLHFEIRRDGKPVDPLTYLPKRSR